MRREQVPHFDFPFRFQPGTPGAPTDCVCTEQDSLEEIVDCVNVILLYPQGFRVELPAFGLPDQAFLESGVTVEVIRTAIDTWEPRAAVAFEHDQQSLQDLIDRVIVSIRTREGVISA